MFAFSRKIIFVLLVLSGLLIGLTACGHSLDDPAVLSDYKSRLLELSGPNPVAKNAIKSGTDTCSKLSGGKLSDVPKVDALDAASVRKAVEYQSISCFADGHLTRAQLQDHVNSDLAEFDKVCNGGLPSKTNSYYLLDAVYSGYPWGKSIICPDGSIHKAE